MKRLTELTHSELSVLREVLKQYKLRYWFATRNFYQRDIIPGFSVDQSVLHFDRFPLVISAKEKSLIHRSGEPYNGLWGMELTLSLMPLGVNLIEYDILNITEEEMEFFVKNTKDYEKEI